jgi:hypothetical protein
MAFLIDDSPIYHHTVQVLRDLGKLGIFGAGDRSFLPTVTEFEVMSPIERWEDTHAVN